MQTIHFIEIYVLYKNNEGIKSSEVIGLGWNHQTQYLPLLSMVNDAQKTNKLRNNKIFRQKKNTLSLRSTLFPSKGEI